MVKASTSILHHEQIRVNGIVQGVGFRPTVWTIAHDEGISGRVWNDSEGVMIDAWGSVAAIDSLCKSLVDDPPPLARIDGIQRTPLSESEPPSSFTIVESREGTIRTGVAADAATCPRCRSELFDPDNRRHRYPFTNCTHCGPRLSIVRAIPYDRVNTSMAKFPMCEACGNEYRNPADRRFHAQPNACPVCGPQLWLVEGNGKKVVLDGDIDPIQKAASLLKKGNILAIKGIGGFHLACDATNDEAVAQLRERKQRYMKPFALMAADVDAIAAYAYVGPQEREFLQGRSAPIVVLKPTHASLPLADGIAPGQTSLGFMLPYTPMHHLLMAEFDAPLVMTSGNRSSEPQVIDNDEAQNRLACIADYWLLHDRDIVNRLDDSVVRLCSNRVRTLRRARGYAPEPIILPPGFENAPELLAMGAELKNTFCLIKGGQAILSQHMGDLEDAATLRDYQKNLDLYAKLYQHEPRHVVVDQHPDYLSTQQGRGIARDKGLELLSVQHHHAHIAAVMAEHRLPIDTDPVLGIALDGLGMGTDGTLWGGEFLLADYRGFRRLAHLAPSPMIGGAKAVIEPWRNVYAQLSTALGWECLLRNYPDLEIVQFLANKPLATLNTMVARNINSPMASSSGRLFDAVAAVLGLSVERVSYEGEAAMGLESLAEGATIDNSDKGYRFDNESEGEVNILSPLSIWVPLLDDLSSGIEPAIIAARFHRGLAISIVQMILRLSLQHPFRKVAVAGGVWQNRVLLEQVDHRLRDEGVELLIPESLPANDGAISFGQAIVAAALTFGSH